MLNPSLYSIENIDSLDSPGLIYFYDIIAENTAKAIALAGSADRLWPHVKSHKTRELIAMQLSMGITRFKCATIAEAQMVAQCGGRDIILAYPQVGPYQARFIKLVQTYPGSRFYAIGDDEKTLAQLSDLSMAAGLRIRTLLDLNMGMDRTGVPLNRAEAVYRACATLPGLSMMGLHGYDGHRHEQDFAVRKANATPAIQETHRLRDTLEADGIPCSLLVMGGTPSFPVHAQYEGEYLSPGTVFLTDWSYLNKAPDLPFVPGAALVARVVSHPEAGLFTIDIGTKAIAAEMQGARGIIVGFEDAEPVLQSEEHWVFRAGKDARLPEIGETLLVIPTHICPTNALYEYATIIRDGKIWSRWSIAARGRTLGI